MNKMSDMLSQEEIDALLKGDSYQNPEKNATEKENLDESEKDALGEIGNISMGTSATTLFTLLGQKVTITTPKVSILTMEELAQQYPVPFVVIQVKYKIGLEGTSLLVLKEDDVKIMTDLMMGGDGTNISEELTELHLSAISEAMNQMVGSAATSLSEILGKKIDIHPPTAFPMNFSTNLPKFELLNPDEKAVKIAFNMVIGNIITDSEIMQILPISFAKNLVANLLQSSVTETPQQEETKNVDQSNNSNKEDAESKQFQSNNQKSLSYETDSDQKNDNTDWRLNQTKDHKTVEVQPVQFPSFEEDYSTTEKENIDLIRDVPLEITVELGRTIKRISEILEFSPGTVIELDKLAGESLDILVNGQFMAKGEVVIIDENYGIRITDILRSNKRVK